MPKLGSDENLARIMRELTAMVPCAYVFRGDLKLRNPRAAELGRRAKLQFIRVAAR